MSSSSSKFTGGDHLTGFDRKMHHMMMQNELHNGHGAYVLSHAKQGRSGFSFGGNQMDLAADHSKVGGKYREHSAAAIFEDILMNARDVTGVRLFHIKDIRTILNIATTSHDPHALDAYLPLINHALSSDYGKNAIDTAYVSALTHKGQHVDRLIDSLSDEATRDALRTNDAMRLRLVDYHNQFGMAAGGAMHQFLEGKSVTIGGGHTLKLSHTPPTSDDIELFIHHTHYGQQHAEDVERRYRNTLAAADLPSLTQEEPSLSSYRIREGDTLTSIASTYHTTVEALMKHNPPLHDADHIRASDILHLPPAANGTAIAIEEMQPHMSTSWSWRI